MKPMTTASILAALWLGAGSAAAADINVLASAAIKPVIDTLGPDYERVSGNRLVVRYELTPAVKKMIDAGEAFDVAIANPPHIDNAVAQGKVASASRFDIVRFGVGLGLRSGAAKPDIGSEDALRKTLLAAGSVAYVGEGTSGAFFRQLLQKLGIAEAMEKKLKPGDVASSLAAVAKGEADLVVMPVPLIMAGLGVELAAPLPPSLQDHIVLSSGIGAGAKNAQAAQAFVNFLAANETTATVRARGYERPAN